MADDTPGLPLVATSCIHPRAVICDAILWKHSAIQYLLAVGGGAGGEDDDIQGTLPSLSLVYWHQNSSSYDPYVAKDQNFNFCGRLI